MLRATITPIWGGGGGDHHKEEHQGNWLIGVTFLFFMEEPLPTDDETIKVIKSCDIQKNKTSRDLKV